MQNYVVIHTKDQSFITHTTMKSVEQLLTPPGFSRVHRSYIVATAKITALDRNQLFAGGYAIPVGRNQLKEIKNGYFPAAKFEG